MLGVDGLRTTVAGVPAMAWGAPARSVLLAVHGLFGNKQDGAIRLAAAAAVPLGYQVVGVDLPGHGERTDADRLVPWHCGPELAAIHDALTSSGRPVDLFACSLGAYFSLLGLADRAVGRAVLISPLVDMAAHIDRLMTARGIDEKHLRAARRITFDDGQYLDWHYRRYARTHPIRWNRPTDVLRGGGHEVVPGADIAAFAAATGARVRHIDAGHAFTTAEDPLVLDWLRTVFADPR